MLTYFSEKKKKWNIKEDIKRFQKYSIEKLHLNLIFYHKFDFPFKIQLSN